MTRLTDKPANARLTKGRKIALYGAVAVVHAGLFAAVGLMAVKGTVPEFAEPVIVELVRWTKPPEPPVDMAVTPQRGGGSPKAPSVVRAPKVPVVVKEPEIVAPPSPAPEQPLVVGRSDSGPPSTSQGQGGIGDGTGSGIGSGDGDGRGQGPRLVRGPSPAELRSVHPREAFRKRQGGRAMLSCRIRLDQRLESCSVVDETPQGMGFGDAALAASRYFRFDPPVRAGQPVAGASVQVGVVWP